ncbi:hypothetical protein GA0070618_1555 [Micromonospora echinospora]|uniref:Uncharacterized protein n=1 Tax=Micromonospora echinospora TaxID=1877 RepID=A0A1C4VUF7_MICEC|nr:hypothetical protein GA0070618_1555 [Micromonospora echinospora]
MESLYALAARLDEASATLAAVAHAATVAGPAPTAFGADGPGRPGDLGRALHRQWVTATDNRAREARAAAARLAAAASAIRDAADRYADTDAAARHRLAAHTPDRHTDAWSRPAAPDVADPWSRPAVPARDVADPWSRPAVPARDVADAWSRPAVPARDVADDPWFGAAPTAAPLHAAGFRAGVDTVPAGSGFPFTADLPPRVPRPRSGDG